MWSSERCIPRLAKRAEGPSNARALARYITRPITRFAIDIAEAVQRLEGPLAVFVTRDDSFSPYFFGFAAGLPASLANVLSRSIAEHAVGQRTFVGRSAEQAAANDVAGIDRDVARDLGSFGTVVIRIVGP